MAASSSADVLRKLDAIRKRSGDDREFSDADLAEIRAKAQADAEMARKQARQESLRRYANLPIRFSDAAVRDFNPINPDAGRARKAVEWFCRDIARNVAEGRNLIFFGNVGTGKTHLACAVANHAINSGFQARYATVSEISREVRRSYDDSDLSEKSVMSRYQTASLLIVDEIGVQHGSEWEQRLMFDVIDYRYAHVLPTIVAGNVDVDEAAKYIGERVMDRLRDNGLIIPFGWESQRRMAGADADSRRPGVSHD